MRPDGKLWHSHNMPGESRSLALFHSLSPSHSRASSYASYSAQHALFRPAAVLQWLEQAELSPSNSYQLDRGGGLSPSCARSAPTRAGMHGGAQHEQQHEQQDEQDEQDEQQQREQREADGVHHGGRSTDAWMHEAEAEHVVALPHDHERDVTEPWSEPAPLEEMTYG